VHPFVLLGTQGICEASSSDSVARQPLNLTPRFTEFFCFLQNDPFSGLIRFSSPCGKSGPKGLEAFYFMIDFRLPENYAVMGYYAANSGNYLPTFRNNLSVPSSGNDP